MVDLESAGAPVGEGAEGETRQGEESDKWSAGRRPTAPEQIEVSTVTIHRIVKEQYDVGDGQLGVRKRPRDPGRQDEDRRERRRRRGDDEA